MSIKAAVVLGTRPEAIKLAPVILAMQRDQVFSCRLIATGQHREMLDEVLRLFDLHPDYDLHVMRPDQSLFDVTSRVLLGLQPILEREAPQVVLVQGDTTSAFAGALAAFYLRIPVAHVEAGLRTADKYRPFPEEINRRMISLLADWHFAPTEWAQNNLLREGISSERVFVTGNTIVDALFEILQRPSPPLPEPIARLTGRERLVLVTAHRRENWGEPLRRICRALRALVDAFQDVVILFAVHLHPRVQRVVHEELEGIPRIFLLGPVPYEVFVHILARSVLILTDSGGIQEEACSLGKPALVLREVTERPEGVEAGILHLVGTKSEHIVAEASRLLRNVQTDQRTAWRPSPYGDGHAAERILRILRERL